MPSTCACSGTACRFLPMICRACQRKVDPQRSFCQNCGSAVFVDEGEMARQTDVVRRMAASMEPTAAAPATARLPRGKGPSRPRVRTPTPAVRPSGCLGSLVRLAVVVAVLWYAVTWLLSIPEVNALKDAFVSGAYSDDQVTAAVNAVRARVLQLVGGG